MTIGTSPNLRTRDIQRATRLLIAWIEGDKLGIDVALGDAAEDPIGTAGLLFAITHTCAMFAEFTAPDGTTAPDQMRQFLIDIQVEGMDP